MIVRIIVGAVAFVSHVLPARRRLQLILLTQFVLAPRRSPVVDMDDYFAGNRDESCIAPNQVGYGRPNLAELYRRLRRIKAMDCVERVLVQLHDEWPESLRESDVWPAAESVHIFARATCEDVKQWTDGFAADLVCEGWPGERHPVVPKASPGVLVYSVGWD